MDSLIEAFKKRVVSATLGTYTFFWLAIHSQGVYVTLFASEDLVYQKYHELKSEYVFEHFFGYHGSLQMSLLWGHRHLGIDPHFIWGIIAPLLLTIVFVWLIQKYLLVYAYREEQRFKSAKRIIKLHEEQAIAEVEARLTRSKTSVIEAEIDLAKKNEQAAQQDPTILWQQDYEEFYNSPVSNGFSSIINAVYQHGGNTRPYIDNGERVVFSVNSNTLAIADSLGLIKIGEGKISLTDKGRYFVSRYKLGK